MSARMAPEPERSRLNDLDPSTITVIIILAVIIVKPGLIACELMVIVIELILIVIHGFETAHADAGVPGFVGGDIAAKT